MKRDPGPTNNVTIKINGRPLEVSGDTGEPNIDATKFLRIGGGEGTFAPDMHVAEVMIFDQKLSDEDEAAIGRKLAAKYSLDTHYSN